MCFPLRRGCFNDYKAFILYVESSILGSSSHRDHTHRERMFGCFTFAKLGSFVNQNYFLFLHYSIFRCSGKTKPLFFEMAFLLFQFRRNLDFLKIFFITFTSILTGHPLRSAQLRESNFLLKRIIGYWPVTFDTWPLTIISKERKLIALEMPFTLEHFFQVSLVLAN